MRNFIKKIAIGISALGGLVVGGLAKAAADSDLTAAFASSTASLTDNKGAVLSWIAGVFGIVILIVIVIAALSRARRQIGGAIGGGRRRR